MNLRLTALVLLAALGIASCSTESEHADASIERATTRARARDYASAHRVLDSAIGRVPDDVRLVLAKADVFAMAHDFDSAEDWYEEARKLDPRSVDAVVGMWTARFEGAQRDSATGAAVRAEADALLSEAPDSLFNLTACARAYYAIGLEDEVGRPAMRLKTLYPETDFAAELIKEDLDWIGVERDDERRLEMADEFLKSYPVTRWRPQALRLKLVSLKRLGRHDEVVEVGRVWAADHPDDPESLDIVAAAFVASGRARDEAVELARRALELSLASTDTGSDGDGSEDGDESAVDETAGYYLTLARALVSAGDLVSAADAARAGLELVETGPDDEETGAAWQFTLGQALEGLGRSDEALDAYLAAVVTGGRQNRWPARADTALGALYESEYATRAGGESLLEFTRERLEYSGPVFTDVTAAVGLEGRGESRIAWGDFDGDGYDDIVLSGRALFRNVGGTAFEDVTDTAGIGGSGTNGGVWADVDNDGDVDLYATSGATEGELTDRLWLNNGDGTFVDATDAAGGMTDHYTTEGAAWGDIDGDGWVDLYLASYERPRTESFQEYGVAYPDILYMNERDGTFRDVTEALGLTPPFGRYLSGRGVNWADYDNDGDLDIYVSNYRLQENLLWRNEAHERFVNVAPEVGVSGLETDGWWGHTIGSAWGDYDNDGDLDLICANLAHPRYIEVSDRSMLYRNMLRSDGSSPPEGLFLERRADAGIKYAETHSNPCWGDIDNDGDLDLFITSIYPDCGSFLYLNDGKGDFTDVTWLAGVRAMNGWGAAMADYDHDGDLDLAVASGSGFHLYRNDGCRGHGPGHWLEVRCEGTRSNATCIGARVAVRSGRTTRLREICGGEGTTSQPSSTAHFGLGRRGGDVTVEVTFPRGQVVTLEDIDVDQMMTVVEPD